MISCLSTSKCKLCKCKLWCVCAGVCVCVQEVPPMQFTQGIIDGVKRRTVEASIELYRGNKIKKQHAFTGRMDEWVGCHCSHIWPMVFYKVDWFFPPDNLQLSGEDGRSLWLQWKEWCIQVSGCRVIVLAEKCACPWPKGSSVCDELKNSHGLKFRSRQRWCLPVSCPILQEICNMKAVAAFQFWSFWPWGKKKTRYITKKGVLISRYGHTGHCTIEKITWMDPDC